MFDKLSRRLDYHLQTIPSLTNDESFSSFMFAFPFPDIGLKAIALCVQLKASFEFSLLAHLKFSLATTWQSWNAK